MPSAHAVLLDLTQTAPMPQVTKSASGGSGFGVLVAAHQAAKPAAAPLATRQAASAHKQAAPEPHAHTETAQQQTPNVVAGSIAKVTVPATAAKIVILPGSQAATPAHGGKGEGNAAHTDLSALQVPPAPLAPPQPANTARHAAIPVPQPFATPEQQPQQLQGNAVLNSLAPEAGTVIPPRDRSFAPAQQMSPPASTIQAGSLQIQTSTADPTSSPPAAVLPPRTENHAEVSLADKAAAPSASDVTESNDSTAASGQAPPPRRAEPSLAPKASIQSPPAISMHGGAMQAVANTKPSTGDTAETFSPPSHAPAAATQSASLGTAPAPPAALGPITMPSGPPPRATEPPVPAVAPPPDLPGHPAPTAAYSPPAAHGKPATAAPAPAALADSPTNLSVVEADSPTPDQIAPTHKAGPAPARTPASPGTASQEEAANTTRQTAVPTVTVPAPNPAATTAPASQAAPRPAVSADTTDDPQVTRVEDVSQAGAVQAAGASAPAAPTQGPAPAATVHAATPPSPAAQVAQAVSSVHVAAGGQGQVTIHLQPGELGAVQVKIERAADGTATVTVQVEKAATLQTMQQDISHLHQALDRAGVPTEQRQVSLHLATPAATVSFGSGTNSDAGPGAGSGFSRGGHSQSQQQGRGQSPAPAATVSAETEDAAPRWVAAGVNITA